MSNINVHGHLYKKRIVRNTAGQIIDWQDEANGGWIIRKGQIVNQERYDEWKKQEEDKKIAAQAILNQKVDPNAPDRTVTAKEAVEQQNKQQELEQRIDAQDKKLDAILEALSKK